LLADRRMDESIEVDVFEAAEAHATGGNGEITAPLPKARKRAARAAP
jgi:hypothetical protein